jgi:putative ABC transport system ATP-binding protein
VVKTLQVELVGLSKAYGVHAVLASICLEVYRGDFIAVEGVPGSGKSTLLGLIGLLDVPSSGVYRLEGRPVAGLSDAERARLRNQTFGFVFQTPLLLTQLSVWQNVARPLLYAGVSRRERRKRALDLLEKLGLADQARVRPVHLSFAEQQRVALARALVNNPAILLVDELTSRLTETQWRPLLELLEAYHRAGTTVLLTTRDPEVAARASRRYRLGEGRLERVRAVKASPDEAPAEEGLQLHLLGRPQVLYRGQSVPLAPRQLELLTLLAAHPEGLSGEQLLLLTYGDEGKRATLKATLSRLRQTIPISNRPYRLDVACHADFTKLTELLGRGEVASAVQLYRGDLLPESDAPGIVELRETLLEAVRQAALTSGDADAIFTLAETQGDDLELWEVALSLLPTDSTRVALAKAQLKRVEKTWGT